MDKYCLTFCQNLRYLRRHHGMTRKELAEVIGISPGKLARLEREEPGCRVNGEMLCRLCDYFDLSADLVLRERIG